MSIFVIFLTFVNIGVGSCVFHCTRVNPGPLGLRERLSESFLLILQAAETKSMPGFFDEAVYPAGKSRQLVCQGFRPTTADRRSRNPQADRD